MKYTKHFWILRWIIIFPVVLNAQIPVTWNYSVEKINDTVYNLHIKAAIQQGWHLYSLHQPVDAMAVPTTVKFSHNPLLLIQDDIKEVGKILKYQDTSLGISAFEYEERVDFIQRILLKRRLKTNIVGAINYQVCTNEKCLPPETTLFNITIL